MTYTIDDRGPITGMPHLSGPARDFRDPITRVVLNGSGDDAVYLYDAGGQRVRKVVRRGANTETRSSIGGGAYEVYREAVSGAQTVERQTLHLMDGGRRVAVVDTLAQHPDHPTTLPDPDQRYQLDNHLGTATVEVNEEAEIIRDEEYHPYGTTAWHASDGDIEVSLKRYRYTGMEKDEETGFAYHGARYYVPWLGRWASADPIGLRDGINRFRYVDNDSIGGADPTGLVRSYGDGKDADDIGKVDYLLPGGLDELTRNRDVREGLYNSRSVERFLDADGNEVSFEDLEVGWTAEVPTGVYFNRYYGDFALRESPLTLRRPAYSPTGQFVGEETLSLTHQDYTIDSDDPTERAQLIDLMQAAEFGEPGDHGLADLIGPTSSGASFFGTAAATGPLVGGIRRTGSGLELASLVQGPATVWGKSADEIADMFNNAGYTATVRQSTRGSGRAQIVSIGGHSEIAQIQVHPGQRRHGGAYVKISTTTEGKIKVVAPETYVPVPIEVVKIVSYQGN